MMACSWTVHLNYVLSQLLLLTTLSNSQTNNNGGSRCLFPDFMYSASGWDSGIRNEGRSSGLYVIFTDSVMLSIDYDNWRTPETESRCEQNLNDNKVLVSYPSGSESSGKPLVYKCIQFLQRSRHIVQMLESDPGDDPTLDLCEDSRLSMNNWIYVWMGTPDEYQSCNPVGGFNILDVYSPTLDHHFCQALSLPPRFESECSYGEAVRVNLRYHQCVANLNMAVTETDFLCLGSWSLERYSYTVITDGANFLPKLWMLRYPVDKTDNFAMDVMKDLVADRDVNITNTEEYVTWSLQKHIFPSLCEDESRDCSDCQEDNGYYCQSTCDKCDPVAVQQRCQFKSIFRGEWLEESWSGYRTIRITSSMIYPTDLPPSECYVIGDDESVAWLEITKRQTLVSIFKNGCRPRYSCVAMHAVASSVIQYRLSQSTVWPHSDNIRPLDICASGAFADDMPPLEARYRNQYEKFLVRSHNREYEPCNLEENIAFNAVFKDNPGEECPGVLKLCASDNKTLILHLPDACQNQKQQQILHCLGSVTQTRTNFLILEGEGKPEKLLCMVWSSEQNRGQMYLLHVSDCNVDVLYSIKHGHFRKYIAELQYASVYNSSKDCLETDIESTASDSSSPSETRDAITSEVSTDFTIKTLTSESTILNTDPTQSFLDNGHKSSTFEYSVTTDQTKGTVLETGHSPSSSGQSPSTSTQSHFEMYLTNGQSKDTVTDMDDTSTKATNEVTTDATNIDSARAVTPNIVLTETNDVVTESDDATLVVTDIVVANTTDGGKVKSNACYCNIRWTIWLFYLIVLSCIF